MTADLSKPLRIPAPLRPAYGNATWTRVWSNDVGVETFRVERESSFAVFVKLASAPVFPTFADEAARMRWAQAHLCVPEVLEVGEAGEQRWLVTRRLPGVDASRRVHTDRPAQTVRLLASGLRRFHEAPVATCPFSFRLDDALAHVRARVERGVVDPARDLHPVHADLTVDQALAKLERDRPEPEDLVVCHGDYCFPNVLIDDEAVTGFVDLGELGVADRWWDLAIGSWSTVWNVGEGYERLFVEAYGEAWDQARVDYYRLLYDLAS